MTIAIILSGGSGSRLGGETPKQYIRIKGRSIIFHTLETIISHPNIAGIVIVAAKEYHDSISSELSKSEIKEKNKILGYAMPGETRQLSVLSGMLFIQDMVGKNLTEAPNYVLVHDAARPNISSSLISECLASVSGHEGVLPVLPMKDTVYLSDNGGKSISGLLDRGKLFAGQAPELFSFEKYLKANLSLVSGSAAYNEDGILEANKESAIYRINGSSEPAVMAGMDIVTIRGDEHNYKITTGEDLDKFAEEKEA